MRGQDVHLLKITHKIVTEEEARTAFEDGQLVVLYWSDYPETGMAFAGEVVRTFNRTMYPLANAIFTVGEQR